MTFHDTPNAFHNIGLAKALGYGKIEIKIKNFEYTTYMQEFSKVMSENIQNWANSHELKELLTMAIPQENQGNSKLEYMQLPDFAETKNDKINGYLKPYSNLDNIALVSLKPLNLQNISTRPPIVTGKQIGRAHV